MSVVLTKTLSGSSAQQRRVMLALTLVTGAISAKKLRAAVQRARREQKALCAEAGTGGGGAGARRGGGAGSRRVAVDAVFAGRIWRILRICVPGPLSREAGLIYLQSLLLLWRTKLSDVTSYLEGRSGRFIIAGDQTEVRKTILLFVAVSVPAAVVNSGLKYTQRRIKLSFQERLSTRLHELYGSRRAYYAATQLRGLSGADQRLTEDVESFSSAAAELYGYTFKPLLDVLLFSRSLATLMGWKPQALLYLYYLGAAALLRAASPPLAALGAEEAALRGSFRGAHARLAANAEEVAFNDPPAGETEVMILDAHLDRYVRHSRLTALQTFCQNLLDGYFVKYGATFVAVSVYVAGAAAVAAKRGVAASVDPSLAAQHRAQDYIRSMRLLQTTSKAIGELVLVYKRVTALAGTTARVSELVEQVRALGGDGGGGDGDAVRKRLFLRNVSSSGSLVPRSASGSLAPAPEPKRLRGDVVSFERVYLASPDGDALVRELSFSVPPGRSVLIMGPNGSGKSSLFRVAAGLWPLSAGTVTTPEPGAIFYLSQKPYLVPGTLRDQLLYPEPPASAWKAASEAARARVRPWIASARMRPDDLDARLHACLDAVELDYLATRNGGLDVARPWADTLSGGERQRLAMARLLFHRPRYAVLDECTSAVSADGEQRLYAAVVAAGITALSIGHRPALARFHSTAVHFEGAAAGKGWHVQSLRQSDAEGLREALSGGVGGDRGVEALGPDARTPGGWFDLPTVSPSK